MMKMGLLISVILTLLALNWMVLAIQFDEVERPAVAPTATPAMSTSDCVTLCNSAFTRADERLLCHEQCHVEYDD